MKRKIIIIIISGILLSGAFIGGYFLSKNLNNKDNEIINLNNTINDLNEKVSQFEKTTSAVVIKQVDGQIFIRKSDNYIYCQLGKDKNGKIIETTAKNDTCVITKPICELLQSTGTVLFEDKPKFLKKC